jgi:hypothetical protein
MSSLFNKMSRGVTENMNTATSSELPNATKGSMMTKFTQNLKKSLNLKQAGGKPLSDKSNPVSP